VILRALTFLLALGSIPAQGCSPAGGTSAPAPVRASVAGRWDYHAPAGASGPAVTLELWLVGADSIAGRVRYWASGDVVLSSHAFGPISGVTGPDPARVQLTIPPPPPGPSLRLECRRVAADTLLIEQSLSGADQGPLDRGRLVRRP